MSESHEKEQTITCGEFIDALRASIDRTPDSPFTTVGLIGCKRSDLIAIPILLEPECKECIDGWVVSISKQVNFPPATPCHCPKGREKEEGRE